MMLLVALAVLAIGQVGYAQQVGDNINVLPVFKSAADYIDELDYARGDLYGNRQGEPKIAVSTANPDHMLAVFNDFRLVDAPDDPPLPGLLASLPEEKHWALTRYFGVPTPAFEQPAHLAGVEAGIGMSVSYDGGITWVGGYVPGQFDGDTTPASLASPGYGLEGGSDPILLAAPCGRFYLVWLQFTRNDVSRLMAALIQDHNDSDLEHTFTWEHTALIAEANNSANGPFVDKPEGSLSLTGATDCSEITEELNVTWTQFTGKGNLDNFQNKLFFGKSVDRAQTFDITKVDDNYTDTSGTATVVDPVTNDIYVFFRSFNPPTMVMTKSTNNGVKWTKPVDLLDTAPMEPFDQPTVSILDMPYGSSIKDEIAPRANAFPTAAITPDGGTLMLAWHERVTLEGAPDPFEAPKVVMIYSTNGGNTWSDRVVIAPTHPPSPSGLGFFNPGFPVGPQIQPRLSCTAGEPNQCLAIFFESRPFAEPWSNPVNSGDVQSNGLSADGFVGGYDRVMDVRGVLIDAPISGEPVFNPSFQVSRYSYRPLLLGEETGETVDYVEEICPPGQTCYPSLNYSGYPHTGGGTSPFLHDYLSNDPLVTHVKDAETGVWRVAERPEDTPYGAAFITAFPDNRNVVRPFENWDGSPIPEGANWQGFGIYTPAGFELDTNGQPVFGSCFNPGSRDQNVLTAKISLGLRVTAPTNYKPFEAPVIEFPMTIWNNTGQERQFELMLTGNPDASFAKDPDGDYPFPLQDGAVKILPYSSSSLNVYVVDGVPGTVTDPVTVNVVECDFVDCASPVGDPLTGSITFNAPAYAPPGSATPIYQYQSSAVAVNPVPRNPVPRNPVPRNPVPRNPVPRNATVEDVIDYSWTVTTASQDDAGTYLTIPNIDKAFQDDYIFQVFVTKPSTLHQVDGACNPSNLPLGTLVGHISDPANPVPRNPVPRNPVPRNPVPRNASLSDTLVQNTTFTMSSDTTAGSELRSISAFGPENCDPVTGGGRFGSCTLFAPRDPNQVTITIRSYQINPEPTRVWNPHGDIPGHPQTLPSVIVADYWCEQAGEGCSFAQDGPELEPDSNTADVAPTPVQAGKTVTFPLDGFGYTNVGTQAAQEHGIGYYISAASEVEDLPRNNDGTIDTGGPETELLDWVAAAALEPEDAANVGSKELTIPLDIPRPNDGVGTYYVWVYVDDQRVVSEIDEDNNFIRGGPITVVPANEPPGNIGFGTIVDANEGEPVSLTVTFDDPGDTGEGYTYIWDFGDGTTCDSSDTPDDCGITAVHIYEEDGLYNLTVTIIDSGGLDGTGSVEVEILNVAPAVDAGPDVTIDEGIDFTSFGSFVDLGADTWTATVSYGDGSGGQPLALNPDQTFSLSHSYASDGVYTVTVTVSDDDGGSASDTATVTVANVAPVANSQSVTTAEDTPVGITLTGSDVGGDELTYRVTSSPASGAVSGSAPNLTYTPNLNSNGSDSFDFVVNDGKVDSAPATVMITVDAINDAPIAVGNSYVTTEDVPLIAAAPGVLGNDTDVDSATLTAMLVSGPSNGTLSFNADGSFSYTPNLDFNGSDAFSYKANDGEADSVAVTVTINVGAVNDGPIANADLYGTNEDTPLSIGAPGVLGNDTDVDSVGLTAELVSGPSSGTLGFNANGSFTYTPAANVFGTVTFTYRAFDGSSYSAPAAVSITVAPINDAPVANDDTYVRTEGASLVVQAECDGEAPDGILCNDTDIDVGDTLTAVLGVGPTDGALGLNTDGSFTYTPNAGHFGSDSFTYVANDGSDDSNSATVTIGLPYGFIGLLSPWREQPLYTFKRGSSFPISWQYSDPATGFVVDSEDAMIEVRIKGPFACNVGEDGGTVEDIKFPGNSDYRYSTGTHKLNWDTNDVGLGCYNIRIYSGNTGQIDGPFKVKIRK